MPRFATRRFRLVIFVTLVAAATSPLAHADFLLGAAPVSTAVPQPEPAATSPARPPAERATDPAPRESPPRFQTAVGFGNRVPLAFAVRQIVPTAVRVSFGPGASRTALVDWRGGDGWNHVLGDAVGKIGLRLVMTYMAVEIRK